MQTWAGTLPTMLISGLYIYKTERKGLAQRLKQCEKQFLTSCLEKEEAFPTALHLSRSMARPVKSLIAEHEACASKSCLTSLPGAVLHASAVHQGFFTPRWPHVPDFFAGCLGYLPGSHQLSGIYSPASNMGRGHWVQTLAWAPMLSNCSTSLAHVWPGLSYKCSDFFALFPPVL